MLSLYYQQRLRSQARPRVDGYCQQTDNPGLDRVIAEIKKQCPEKFHTPESLKLRVFMNEPRRPIPHAGFIHFAPF